MERHRRRVALLYMREGRGGHGERGAALVLKRHRERQRMLRI